MPDQVTAPEPAQFADRLVELAWFLLGEDSLDAILTRVVTLADQLLEPVVAASISLRRGGRYVTPAHSADLAKRIDECQYEADAGPCVDALKLGHAMLIRSLADASAWPETQQAAREEGVESILSLPLVAGKVGVVGALNLYSCDEDGFSDVRGAADLFAQHAAIVLANARAYAEAEEVAAGLRQALLTREVIGVAKGILMERDGLSWDEAFDALRERSQHSNQKLRDVAAAIVRERSGAEPPTE